jgi:hypothetical protein
MTQLMVAANRFSDTASLSGDGAFTNASGARKTAAIEFGSLSLTPTVSFNAASSSLENMSGISSPQCS